MLMPRSLNTISMSVLRLFLFLALIGPVLSAIYVVEPLDDQLPPVARVNTSYSWTFSEHTFNSTRGEAITYSAHHLPPWMSFDPATRTFTGTPSADDRASLVGRPYVAVTASTANSSATSHLRFCVAESPPPILRIPLSDQFISSNKALASVFTVPQGSALASPNPGLRLPSGPWTFSIGFQGGTFASQDNIFYTARFANGSRIPDWMVFNPDDYTLEGNVPSDVGLEGPEVLSMSLVASDQEGYTAQALPFTITVASHELSAVAQELPTINVTAGVPFAVILSSPADFTGYLVDGTRLHPENITRLEIDTGGVDWLRYEPLTRTLAGTPRSNLTNNRVTLPVNITTWFNQSLQTTVSLQLVPSFFSLPQFPALHLNSGDSFQMGLDQYYSNSTAGRDGDADISIALDPVQATDFIQYNRGSAGDTISGTIPQDFAQDHITTAFTAYSRITHSTSHANLIIFVNTIPGSANGSIPHLSGLAVQARRRLVLGLAITFGILGGLLFTACFFAWFRRVARPEGSVVSGEEGRRAWTKKERKYYGLDIGSEKAESIRRAEPPPFSQYTPTAGMDRTQSGSSFGHDLHRVLERSHSASLNGIGLLNPMSRVMSKREFMTRVKQTVRQVSNKYGTGRNKPQQPTLRPLIGRPILLRPPTQLNIGQEVSPTNPFDDVHSQRASTFMSGSPSSSTAEHSIPRRRADFAPPRAMAQVRFDDGRLIRQPSNASMGDGASRRTSVRSGRSTSMLSHEFNPATGETISARPRLVPFTSSTRVPVPRVPSPTSQMTGGPTASLMVNPAANKSRISSQRAKIVKPPPPGGPKEKDDGVKPSSSGDDLTMGLHYVQSLGDHSPEPRAPSPKTSPEVTRYVLRTGEKFQIRLQITPTARKLQVTQVSGQEIPKFLKVDANGSKGMVELTGTALSRDLGMLTIGVYAEKQCLVKVILEVIPRK
ncbi:hypothetical protein BKA70DRAFT_472338 [Coprinopsis sp. MPI-PUGE-AT-0042]|nr:hypothetical protein BKA70DRAFT_472338 [Coprinopsis sp. MPI-PUGE-AT-0042]